MKALKHLPLSLYLLCFLARAAVAEELSVIITPESKEVFQGGVVVISVSGKGLAGVQAFRGDRKIPFSPRGVNGSYRALVGVDLEEEPGLMKIIIKTWGKGEREVPVVLCVKNKAFPTEHITVAAALDRFDEMTLKRIQREQDRMDQIWSTSTPQRRWRGGFIVPVSGEVTSPFGLHRIINGSPRSPHGGVDLKAPLGLEVVAANHGRVALRDQFFFSGKSIVLDHGGGLYTMYFHLSDFRVDEGSQVRKGEVIGWAGMTGRVTGPHLHWGVRLNAARIDPFELLGEVWEGR